MTKKLAKHLSLPYSRDSADLESRKRQALPGALPLESVSCPSELGKLHGCQAQQKPLCLSCA